jgi:hypothetical protein
MILSGLGARSTPDRLQSQHVRVKALAAAGMATRAGRHAGQAPRNPSDSRS